MRGKLGKLTAIAALSACNLGCQRAVEWTTYRNLRQQVNLHYKEDLAVSTEPPGARIYVDDQMIGRSPLNCQADFGLLKLVRLGRQARQHEAQAHVLSGKLVEETHAVRDGETVWGAWSWGGGHEGNEVDLKVFHEDHAAGQKKIVLSMNDKSIRKALSNASETFRGAAGGAAGEEVVQVSGSRAVLLLLVPSKKRK
jgi:hypothetical protein